MNIRECPNCGWSCVSVHKTPHSKRFYVGCANCHWVGAAKFFRLSAILAWNKESRHYPHTIPQPPRQQWVFLHR